MKFIDTWAIRALGALFIMTFAAGCFIGRPYDGYSNSGWNNNRGYYGASDRDHDRDNDRSSREYSQGYSRYAY